MEKRLPVLLVALIGFVAAVLCAILFTQVMILRRLPPTYGQLADAAKAQNKEEYREILLRVPLVRVNNTVAVEIEK
jgi:hypothetical protein